MQCQGRITTLFQALGKRIGDAVCEVARRIDPDIDPDIGRFGGMAGIAGFTELRWITMQATRRHYPFY